MEDQRLRARLLSVRFTALLLNPQTSSVNARLRLLLEVRIQSNVAHLGWSISLHRGRSRALWAPWGGPFRYAGADPGNLRRLPVYGEVPNEPPRRQGVG